jgi:CRISPR-associated protein Cas1
MIIAGMSWLERIVDISQEGLHLSRDRGCMKIEVANETIGRVPLDQIAAVIVHSHGITWSNSLLVELADRGAPVVFCGSNHQPKAVICTLDGHHMQNARMRAQWNAPQPLIKQAWKQIVITKIKMQAAALTAIGQPAAPLEVLSRSVQSGDSGNTEAQAARIYWPMMMGKGFRRNVDLPDVNALLNYGYTVLRAATARAVVAAGLHPTIGLFHSNRSNAFALADDLMEPIRPLIDLTARAIAAADGPGVTSQAKRRMADVLAFDLQITGETSPVSVVLSRLAVSLAQSFETRRLRLALPESPAPVVLSGLGK